MDLKNFPNSNVPGFLSKLWLLVEDDATNELIGWGPFGNSFIVQDQTRFAKEILPKYFKHSNMASFIRQLNMYGFRKKANLEHGSLKVDKDDIEFQHPSFLKGRSDLLEHIKRKVSARDETKLKMEDVHQILTDVQDMKGKQDNITGTLESIQRDNQVLWREVVFLRQRHEKQQKIVNQLIQFLLTMVKPVGLKRKQQLMIESASDQSKPKYSRLANPSDSLQLVQATSYDTDLDNLPEITSIPSGAILSDVTDIPMMASPILSTGDEAGTAAVSDQTPATLDPSLFELDIPPMLPETSREVPSPLVASPASVQIASANLLSPSIENPYNSLFSLSESAGQSNTDVASFFSSDDDNQIATGSWGSMSGATTSSPSSRALMKRMLSHDEQRGELGEHVNTVQENLDLIHHMLASPMCSSIPCNVEMGSLMEIFNSDNTSETDLFPILAGTNSQNTNDQSSDYQGSIKGTEVVQYNPSSTSPFTAEDEDSLLRSLDDDAAALETPDTVSMPNRLKH